MATIVIGDDIALAITLKKNNATFDIDSTSTVTVQFIDKDTDLSMLTSDVDVPEANQGSDWPNSVIVIEVPSATSLGLEEGEALIEIQVDDDVNTTGKTTWFADITIEGHTIP